LRCAKICLPSRLGVAYDVIVAFPGFVKQWYGTDPISTIILGCRRVAKDNHSNKSEWALPSSDVF
jgi:hypothetical protein